MINLFPKENKQTKPPKSEKSKCMYSPSIHLSTVGGKGLNNLKRLSSETITKSQSFLLVTFSFFYEILKIRYFLSLNLTPPKCFTHNHYNVNNNNDYITMMINIINYGG